MTVWPILSFLNVWQKTTTYDRLFALSRQNTYCLGCKGDVLIREPQPTEPWQSQGLTSIPFVGDSLSASSHLVRIYWLEKPSDGEITHTPTPMSIYIFWRILTQIFIYDRISGISYLMRSSWGIWLRSLY
jgi:hypothetical protein